MKLSNEVHILVDALLLAVLAPTEEQSLKAVELADRIAVTMSPVEVDIAKRLTADVLEEVLDDE